MNVPSGYSALDLVGFTDKGDYSASTNYVKNDLVHYDDKIWKCLIDDTTAIEPTEGVNWTLWIQQSNSLDGLADVEITNAQDGQEITYDGTTQKWKNTSKFQTLTNQVTALLDNTEVNGAVNLIYPNGTSKVEGGITYQLNDDGTVVANGTPTGNSGFGWVTFNGENLVGKTLEFSCETTNVYPRAYFAIICRETVSGPNLLREDAFLEDKKVKVAFTVPSNTKIIIVNFNTNTDTTDNISTTLKPMLTVPSYNGDYVPYAKSNKELTEDIASVLPIVKVAIEITTTESFENLKNGITYRFSTSDTESPFSGYNVAVKVAKVASTSGVQIAFKVVSSTNTELDLLAIRPCLGGTYGAWRKFSGVIPT